MGAVKRPLPPAHTRAASSHVPTWGTSDGTSFALTFAVTPEAGKGQSLSSITGGDSVRRGASPVLRRVISEPSQDGAHLLGLCPPVSLGGSLSSPQC